MTRLYTSKNRYLFIKKKKRYHLWFLLFFIITSAVFYLYRLEQIGSVRPWKIIPIEVDDLPDCIVEGSSKIFRAFIFDKIFSNRSGGKNNQPRELYQGFLQQNTEVYLDEPLNIQSFSEFCAIDLDYLLLRNSFIEGQRSFGTFWLIEGTMLNLTFAEKYCLSQFNQEYCNFVEYKVQSGDRLIKIAAKYGVPLDIMIELNEVKKPDSLPVESFLVLPCYSHQQISRSQPETANIFQ